ncbi:uncharacterized protein LOC119579849 [Penaeus monodon]|uniref:uncharacterized protein LOC119579849 n=1 Tax=Penaeus monodon TaxID=6687 RepID=UPI0018A6E880|nr:uncharacterized protein LOC119579849 [Penaeus monodon]
MKGPCVRVFVTLASASAFLLPLLTPTAHAQDSSPSGKWADFFKTKNDINVEMLTNVVTTKTGNAVSSRQGCKESIDLNAGETYVIYSENDGTKLKCTYSVKGPSGKVLGIVCPQFNLNSAGCKAEKFILKISGAKPLTFCETEAPNGKVPGNSLTINYKRKALSSNQCSGGFVCFILVLDGLFMPFALRKRNLALPVLESRLYAFCNKSFAGSGVHWEEKCVQPGGYTLRQAGTCYCIIRGR